MKRHLRFALFGLIICITAQAKDYTPNDVYAEALLFEENIKQWKTKEGKLHHWVNVAVEDNYHPRHVFLKAIEILQKINRYRVNVAKLGPIPVDYSVGREITPNEVYNEVHHARQEMLAMLQNIGVFIEDTVIKHKVTGKTPNDVYAKLREISLALDESLGLRGLSPSDVYNRSQQIVLLSKFLRSSQNLSLTIPEIKRTKGNFSNHSLAAVKTLIAKINTAEKNLSIDPVRVIKVPRRVINPSDVYDAMGIVIAELQRIQYHLGLERSFPLDQTQTNKTIDDVMFNTTLAQALLPSFLDNTKLQQYDANWLVKTPSDVFSLTHYILSGLYKYCRLKGIKIPRFAPPKVSNLKSQHVYTKGLEALEMIVLLRKNQGMGLSATPNYPLKEITPQEVFDLSLRIDKYLNLVFTQSEMVSNTWLATEKIEYFDNKTPSDVYINMWKISTTLKAILSNQGFNSDHIFKKMDYLEGKIDIINRHLASISTIEKKQTITKTTDKNSRDNKPEPIENKAVLKKTLYLKALIEKIKDQQGLSTNARISLPLISDVEISDIYSELWQLDASLSELELYLGIDEQVVKVVKDRNRTNLYHEIILIEKKIMTLSNYFINVNTRKL